MVKKSDWPVLNLTCFPHVLKLTMMTQIDFKGLPHSNTNSGFFPG